MEKTTRSSDYFKMMNIIYAVQALSLLGFSVVVLYLNPQQPDKNLTETIQYALAGSSLAALAASQFVPRLMLKKIDERLELRYKVPKYLPVALLRAAFMEAAGLIVCITAFISGQTYFLFIIALLLLLFFFYRPTKSMVATELNLSVKERELLNNPETVFVQGIK